MQQEEKDKEVLPVEKRKIKGVVKHVLIILPGLHEQWVTPRKFIQYVFPPTKLSNGEYLPEAKERWLESMSYLLDDIWWLCELQYHQFWSQVIFDSTSMNSIKTFLHLAPLQQLYFKIDDQDMLLMYKRIKKAVFQFMKRLLRTKESNLNYMSAEKYSEIMKKNNLVPVSLLFCLCTLYAKKELEIVREMIAHVVQYNENVKLDNCVVRSIQLFSRMKTKLKQSYRDLKENMKYSENAEEVRCAVNAYRQNLSSSVQFLANAALNISNFLNVYAEGCEMFLIHDFDFHIVRVYKKVIIPGYLEISIFYGDNRYLQSYPRLISMLELIRLEFVKSFHVCLRTLVNRLGTRLLAQETIQRIVQLMKMALKVENFCTDVNSVKRLSEFHDLVKETCPSDIDLTALNNVFKSINDELQAMKNEPNVKEKCIEDDQVYDYVHDDYDALSDDSMEFENNREMENGTLSSTDYSSDYSDWSKNENSDAEYEGYLEDDTSTNLSLMNLEPGPSTNSAIPMSEMGLQSAISQVKDLLPHLGEGFIAMCLRAYKMDVSAVINATLENTLLPSLKEVDFSLSQIPDDILKEVEREYENIPSTSTECKDENSGLREFKRVEYSSYKDMFNDKRAISQAKTIYEKYRNTEEDELYDDDVDEDYEEQLYAPPAEIDAEGFYTEYTNLPTRNPNHVYEDDEEYSELEQEAKCQPSQDAQSNNHWKSQHDKSFRKQKSSESCENSEQVRDRDDRHRQKNKERLKRKKLEAREKDNRKSEHQRENVRGERRYRENFGDKVRNRENIRVKVRDGENIGAEQRSTETIRREDCFRENARNEHHNRTKIQIDDRNQRPSNARETREESYARDDNLKSLDFCENPEEIRARREHHYRMKQEKRRGPKQFYNSNFGKSTEVGEEREQRDRHYKNVNKSSHGNHSRRFFSDQKRRQQ